MSVLRHYEEIRDATDDEEDVVAPDGPLQGQGHSNIRVERWSMASNWRARVYVVWRVARGVSGGGCWASWG